MAELYKNAGIEAARMVGISDAMDDLADHTAAKIRAIASAHADTGAFAESIRVEKKMGEDGVLDRLVSSEVEGIMAIEFGHHEGDTFVPGKFAFTQVAHSG